MIETGTILQNRYRIEKQIGQGGMGKVYVATDERFNSTVAIKETVFEDAGLRKAFEREARLLNSLKHPALPRVSDHFTENNGQFLVMEYIAGEDLAEMIEQSGKAFPLDDVLKWAYQLCDALEFLHLQNIIHRDIKPQNLKLTPNGQIVLLDFGLAKGNATDAPHQTAAKSIFGYSRNYASLEQIQGTGTEPRSDLYSLSATLYHLLTGVPPADALTRAMNVLNNQSDPLLEADTINEKVPGGVSQVLQKAMALNAAERPVSASAMRSMLDESDKSIGLNDKNVTVENLLTTDFLTQETKIMAAADSMPNISSSEVQTKISPQNTADKSSYKTRIVGDDDESKITNIQKSAENTKSPKRARAVGSAVLAGLLLVGSAASGVYFYSSGGTQTNSNAASANSEKTQDFTAESNEAKISNVTPSDENLSNRALSNKNSDLAVESVNAKPTGTEDRMKPADLVQKKAKETKDQSGNSQPLGKSKKNEADNNDIIVNDETDTVEMNGMIIDENGIRPKVPRIPRRSNGTPPPPPETFTSLTPEQIRKLKRLGEGKSRVIVINKPTPKPTP